MKVDGGKNPRVVEMTRKEILEEKKIGYAGIKLDFDLTSQEKSMIKDPVLDTCADLKEFREAPPNSDR
ncbi:9946_t:CDS:2 [Paraglomus brasilianum]|uniref:9946_t:CDS:1 n=1 Tax=Paraglomus brasilianum TaxID=144538 RepID=A0A9N9BP67_9GLOM|nr:9946_t:CDS:2 [Paraglomus brasilianum]